MPITQDTATGDLTSLAAIAESTFGVAPSIGNLQKLRYTKHTLKATNASERSKELRGDRQVSDLRRVSVGASGGIDVEFSADAHDEFMLAAIAAPNQSFTGPSTANTPASTTSNASAGTIAGTGIGTGASVGDFVLIAGFVNSGNNGYFRITVASANSITVDPKPSGADETGVAGVTSQVLSSEPNGIVMNSFTMVENRLGIANTVDGDYTVGSGFVIDKWSFDAKVQSFATMNFDFIGKSWAPANASPTGLTDVAALTNQVMATVDEVVAFVYGPSGSSVKTDVESFSFSVSNNLRPRLNLGDLGPNSMGFGKFVVTGNMNAYFKDGAMMSAFTNDTDNLRCAFIMKDSTGETYVFDFPRIKFTDGNAANDGENSDTMSQMTFEAIAEVATGQMMFIHKLIV